MKCWKCIGPQNYPYIWRSTDFSLSDECIRTYSVCRGYLCTGNVWISILFIQSIDAITASLEWGTFFQLNSSWDWASFMLFKQKTSMRVLKIIWNFFVWTVLVNTSKPNKLWIIQETLRDFIRKMFYIKTFSITQLYYKSSYANMTN